MGRRLIASIVAGLLTPAAAAAQSRIAFSGFVDVYDSYNTNRPASGQTALRNFDVQHNSLTLNLAELSAEKQAASDSRGGFRVDLAFGRTAALVHVSDPEADHVKNVLQAYASYLAPVGSGLQIDFGKFLTPIGNEVIKTKDNWNYSRSLVFTLAEPYYHSGLRASYTVNDRVSWSALLVNGWNNVTDNNGAKTVGGQVTLKPTAALTIAQAYLGGPEQPGNNDDWRHLLDTVVTYTATPKLSLAMNYDYGRDTVSGAAVTWQGIAGYLHVQPRGWFALTPRVEYYSDPDGFSTGTAQKLTTWTVTAEFNAANGPVLRAEYRRDQSNTAFFPLHASGLSTHQGTVTVGVVYAFTSR